MHFGKVVKFVKVSKELDIFVRIASILFMQVFGELSRTSVFRVRNELSPATIKTTK